MFYYTRIHILILLYSFTQLLMSNKSVCVYHLLTLKTLMTFLHTNMVCYVTLIAKHLSFFKDQA